MATHSSVLTWRIPGTVEPGGLPSIGWHRVRQDWSDLAAAAYKVWLEGLRTSWVLLVCSSCLWFDSRYCRYWVLVLKGLVGLHTTVQLQLLQHYWLGHKLGLLWYWMVCLGNKQILSFLRFQPRTTFQTLLLTMMATPFLLRDSCPRVDIMVIWVKFTHSSPF